MLSGQAIANPECLKDCFAKTSGGGLDAELDESDPSCFASLIDDVTSKGTCDDGINPAAQYNATVNFWGWNDLGNNCILDASKIIQGTCSPTTERDLQNIGCMKFFMEQPNIIKNTLQLLIQHSCSDDLYNSLPFSGPRLRGQRKKNRKVHKSRLAPITQVNLASNTKTELNFENTRHRYPWICSLRRRGLNSEHLCAVNLLAVPPNPTVIVGSAHCTYMCKDQDENGVVLPPCCCVNVERGQ